uniref:(northern house mosquito) hypothetical protein n=1 Tax=Culex pipiens TaxID=7175 RepID=A0A8D8AU29_CULPI
MGARCIRLKFQYYPDRPRCLPREVQHGLSGPGGSFLPPPLSSRQSRPLRRLRYEDKKPFVKCSTICTFKTYSSSQFYFYTKQNVFIFLFKYNKEPVTRQNDFTGNNFVKPDDEFYNFH